MQMDDDLSNTMDLTDGMLGDDDLDIDPEPFSTPTAKQEYSGIERFKRAVSILATGTWDGAVYSRRDRATIAWKGGLSFVVVLALSSLVLDSLGYHPEPIWTIEVMARAAILGAIDQVAKLAQFGVNNEWATLLVALVLLLAYRR